MIVFDIKIFPYEASAIETNNWPSYVKLKAVLLFYKIDSEYD